MNCSRMHHKPKSVVSSVLNVLFLFFHFLQPLGNNNCLWYIIIPMVHAFCIQTISIFTLLKENCHSCSIAELSLHGKDIKHSIS